MLRIKAPFGFLELLGWNSGKQMSEMIGPGSEYFGGDILELNGITVIENYYPYERVWARMAKLMELNGSAQAEVDAAAKAFVLRMQQRKPLAQEQLVEALWSVLKNLPHAKHFNRQSHQSYDLHTVPTRDTLKNSVKRLPVPTPTLSLGYHKGEFLGCIEDDLQDGIIANAEGEPVDLGRISQPINGHFWPFLIIEVSEISMLAAQHHAAVAAASCNSAMSTLAYAIESRPDEEVPVSAIDPVASYDVCFSLTIFHKVAVLNLHAPRGPDLYVRSALKEYRLDVEAEFNELLDSLNCIMVWGRTLRLPQIIEGLQWLDRKVHGKAKLSPPETRFEGEFDPVILQSLQVRPLHGLRRFKLVSEAVLPIWVKAE